MNHPTPKTVFVAGTDTDVGKTYVASLIAAGLYELGQSVGVYKPVASGCELFDGKLVAGDAMQLWEAAGRPRTLADVCPQKFIAPLAPPQAARDDGKQIDMDLLRRGADVWLDGFDVRIIEGAGGLFSPLADDLLNIDFLKQFDDTSLLIVAANRLGVIHQVIATCTAARQHGITPDGVILCRTNNEDDDSIATNREGVERYCDVPVIGSIGFRDTSWGEIARSAHLFASE